MWPDDVCTTEDGRTEAEILPDVVCTTEDGKTDTLTFPNESVCTTFAGSTPFASFPVEMLKTVVPRICSVLLVLFVPPPICIESATAEA